MKYIQLRTVLLDFFRFFRNIYILTSENYLSPDRRFSMSLASHIKDAFGAVTFDTASIKRLAKDKTSFGYGILILALAGVASGISILNVWWAIIAPFVAVICTFIGVGVLHALSLLFGGKGRYRELFHALSHTAVLNWSMVVPFIGILFGIMASLWRLVAAVPIIQEVHKLPRDKAVAVVLIPVVILISLFFIIIYFVMVFGLIFLGASGFLGNLTAANLSG